MNSNKTWFLPGGEETKLKQGMRFGTKRKWIRVSNLQRLPTFP